MKTIIERRSAIIPEFNITHKTTIFSNKIESNVDVKYDDKWITIIYCDKVKLKMEKYQKISVRLNSLTQEDNHQRKLNIKILEFVDFM